MNLRNIGWGSMDWIDLAHDMDASRALVNMVLTLGFYKMLENSCLAAELGSSEEGLSSMELVSYACY
jgi:hypothetical protein